MTTCEHAWSVDGIAEIDDELMETQGHLDLTCARCGALAQLQRPTFLECYQVTRGWLQGFNPGFYEPAGGDDRLVIVLEGTRGDDLLTAGADGDIDDIGTMGWLGSAADDRDDHHADAPAELGMQVFDLREHDWHVYDLMETDRPGEFDIALFCTRCDAWASVANPTTEERETIAKAHDMRMGLSWTDDTRVTGIWFNDGQTSIDDITGEDDQPRPPVADLVDGLDLFGGDDDDIPF